MQARNLNIFFACIFYIEGKAYVRKKPPAFIIGCNKGCKSRKCLIYTLYCGERGIRTPGASQLNGFQDRRNRPLCHLSECKSITDFRFCQIFPPGNSKSPDQKNVLKQ